MQDPAPNAPRQFTADESMLGDRMIFVPYNWAIQILPEKEQDTLTVDQLLSQLCCQDGPTDRQEKGGVVWLGYQMSMSRTGEANMSTAIAYLRGNGFVQVDSI